MSLHSVEAPNEVYNASPAIAAVIELLKHRGHDPAYNKDTWFKVQKQDFDPLKDYLLPIVKTERADYDGALNLIKKESMEKNRNHFESLQAKVDNVEAADENGLAAAIFILAASMRDMKRLTLRMQTRVKTYYRLRKGSEKAGWESWKNTCKREGRKI